MTKSDPAQFLGVPAPLRWPVYQDYTVEEGVIRTVGPVAETYDPLRHPEVVGQLAKLQEGNVQRALKFARSWGLLGWEQETGASLAGGEPLQWVWGHAKNIRLALEILYYKQEDDADGLTQYLDAYKTGLPSDESGEPLLTIFRSQEPPIQGSIKGFDGGDILMRIFNWNLKGIYVELDPETLKFHPHIISLLGGIYELLQDSISEGRSIGRCQDAECRALFLITDRRQKYCPPPRGARSSSCGARDRKRQQGEEK